MKTPRTARSFRYTLIQELAPHVEKKWADAFILKLRTASVAGARIGSSLKEVDSHCAESGSSAVEAFGNPERYARSLNLPVEDVGRGPLAPLAPTLLEIVGMVVLTWSCPGLFRGQAFVLTTGQVLTAVLLAAELAALVLGNRRAVLAVVRHPVLAWLIFMANMALMVALIGTFGSSLARLHAGWSAGLGAALLLGGLAWNLLRRRAGKSGVDPVVAPAFTENQRAVVVAARRQAGVASAVNAWLMPLAALVIVPMEWALR